jgi:tetratricopeptide (TPR) repeat protein
MRRNGSWLAILALVAALGGPARARPLDDAHGRAPALFVAAKLAALAGDWGEALALFDEAIAADGEAFYLRLEYAEALLRAAIDHSVGERPDLLARAAEQAEAAARIAPGDVEALRLLAQVRLAAAQVDPAERPMALQALAALHAASPDGPAALSYARLLLEERRPADAVAILRETLQRLARSGASPADRRAGRGIAGLLVEAVRQAAESGGVDAEAVLREALAADASLLEARLALAAIELERGEAAGALAILDQTPPAQKDLAEVRVQRTLARLRAGDFEGALAELDDDILTARQATLLRAMVLDAEGRFAAAARVLDPWVAANPDDVEAAATYARVLYRLERGREAQALFAALAQRLAATGAAERAPWVRLRAALLAAAFEDWAAVDRLTVALATNAPPGDAVGSEALALRAEAMIATDRAAEALRILDGAGDDPTLEGKRAEAQAALGRRSAAARRLEKLARRGEQAALVAIEAFQRMERHREALRLAEGVLAANPASVPAMFRRAAALERLGRRAESEAAFRTLLERAPSFAPALNYLGYMLAERGEKPAEALALTRRAVALDPQSGAYADSLGWASYRVGDLESARRELLRASRLEPDATVFEHLGDVLAALGDRRAAKEAYGRAEGLGPERPRELRRKIESLDATAPPGVPPAAPNTAQPR